MDIDVDEAMERLDEVTAPKGNLIEASGHGRPVKPKAFPVPGTDGKYLTGRDPLRFHPNTAGNRAQGLARGAPARGDARKAVAAEADEKLLNERDQAEEQLTCFLYLLARDHVPVGVLNQLRADSVVDDKWTYNHFKFSDPNLEKLARNLAQRLMGLIGPQDWEVAPTKFEGNER